MVKLSDYLSYLSNEIAQARKGMDLEAIKRAKEYSAHEYLKYFKAPRFIMPSIKLELPIKISSIDSDVTYAFNLDKDDFKRRLNERVALIEEEHAVELKHFTRDDLDKKDFTNLVKELKEKDDKSIGRVDYNFNNLILKKPIKEIIRPMRAIRDFTTMDNSSSEEIKNKVEEAFRETLLEQYRPVSAKLNNILIQPDTNSLKKSGDDKILVKLTVELVEENLQIVKLIDKDGKEYEEIIID
jgi:hypothetical protein